MTTAPVRTAPWVQFRDQLQTRRHDRVLKKALRRDLSSFTTASDLLDLDTILDHHDPVSTVEVRRILNRQRAV